MKKTLRNLSAFIIAASLAVTSLSFTVGAQSDTSQTIVPQAEKIGDVRTVECVPNDGVAYKAELYAPVAYGSATIFDRVENYGYKNRYYYKHLSSDKLRTAFDRMYETMKSAALSYKDYSGDENDPNAYVAIDLAGLGVLSTSESTEPSEVLQLYNSFMFECSEFYWLDGYASFSASDGKITTIAMLVSSEFYSGELRRQTDAAILETIDEYTAAVEGLTDTYDQLLTVFNKICDESIYKFVDDVPDDSQMSHSLAGIMTDGINAGVCESYAYSLQLIMNSLGKECISVIGLAGRSGSYGEHVWNIAKLDDGKYYWLDATWADYSEVTGVSYYNRVNYDYFLTADDVMAQTHSEQLLANKITCGLPEMENTAYVPAGGSLLKIGDIFTVDNITYRVNTDTPHSNTVGLYSATGYTSDTVVIEPTVTYSDRTFTVTSIDNNAYSNGTPLDSITIPKTVTSVNSSAFINIYGSIVIHGYSGSAAETYAALLGLTFEPIVESDFTTAVNPDGTLTITACSLTAASIKIPAFIDGRVVSGIAKDAFTSCAASEISVPKTVTAIADGAFSASQKILAYSGSTAYVYATDNSLTVENAVVPERLGMLNDDAEVNSADALLALKQSVSMVSLSDEILELADMDMDGSVNSADALIMLKISVGIIDLSEYKANL